MPAEDTGAVILTIIFPLCGILWEIKTLRMLMDSGEAILSFARVIILDYSREEGGDDVCP